MDKFGGNGSTEDYDGKYCLNKEKKYHRHSAEQIQRLETYFNDNPLPNESQRRNLGHELGLEPLQIKFWFQNKRTQEKTQNERTDNNSLRMENERIHCENIALMEAIEKVVCPYCNDPTLIDLERHRVEMLQIENFRLKNKLAALQQQLAGLSGGLSGGSSYVLSSGPSGGLPSGLSRGNSGGFSGGLSSGHSGGLSSGLSRKHDISFHGLTNEMGHPRSTSLSIGNRLSPGIGAFPLIGLEHPLGNLRGTLIGNEESIRTLKDPSHQN